MNFFTKLFGWVELALSWFDFFSAWLTRVRKAYPGLVEMITPLVQDWNVVIDGAATHQEEDEIQKQARETIVNAVKDATQGSPRAVPEHAIRTTLEAVVYTEKVKSGAVYYERKAVRNHAIEVLSRRG